MVDGGELSFDRRIDFAKVRSFFLHKYLSAPLMGKGAELLTTGNSTPLSFLALFSLLEKPTISRI